MCMSITFILYKDRTNEVQNQKIRVCAVISVCTIAAVTGIGVSREILEKKYKNRGHKINSKHADFGPVIGPEGKVLFFTSDRPGGAGGPDIWMSERVDTVWGTAVNPGGPINTSVRESPGSYFLSANPTLYFTACGRDVYEMACPVKFNKCTGGRARQGRRPG